MDLENFIKDQVRRKATVMQIGGFKPSGDITASWFGKVNLALSGEGWPQTDGKPMHALCQVNLTQLPFIPELLKDLEFITVFVGPADLPNNSENGYNWCLRAYKKLSELESLDQIDTGSRI